MKTPHNDVIIDQFTRQAAPFANAAPIRNDDLLRRIVERAEAHADDRSLDVACGPGLLVCAFAKIVKHATGIDLTPAMLEQARRLENEQPLHNVTWTLGDVTSLPYRDREFSIVTSRFAFHHLPEPRAALKEMLRVCQQGGRIVVADTAPAAPKADAFNAMERLRDPSHTRALPPEELRSLFAQEGLAPRLEMYRLPGDLDSLLARSFPVEGDAGRIRKIFEASLQDDALDMATRAANGQILYAFPIAILIAVAPRL
jgi:ubiquinone/menaquinone biosynthesis C-methylase UbiE